MDVLEPRPQKNVRKALSPTIPDQMASLEIDVPLLLLPGSYKLFSSRTDKLLLFKIGFSLDQHNGVILLYSLC